MSGRAMFLAPVQEPPAMPDDPETAFFGERRGQPVLDRGPATSNPPRQGVPAETAARC